MDTFRRNIPLLALAQALMMSATSMIITAGALAGQQLADDKSLATLPLALQFIATMLVAIPASLLLKKIGRKRGFMLATGLGVAGGLVGAYGLSSGQFWVFAIAGLLVGSFNAFGNYYRFTAADSVTVEFKAKAISYVMAGGVIAAFVGPNLANWTRNMLPEAPFAGSYLSIVVVYLLSLLVLSGLKLPHVAADEVDSAAESEARPLLEIVTQTKFIVAVVCGMLGYGVMSFLMTATPLAMSLHQHPFGDTSFVIQWHVLGMFAPSFFTGHLIKRFGLTSILISGALLGFACVATNLLGTTLWHFWLALVMLGVSWNFLFVGASTLLTETYHPSERAKTQAINDFLIFTTVAAASLLAGTLQHLYGWETVNLGVLPMLALVLFSIVWLKLQSGKAA